MVVPLSFSHLCCPKRVQCKGGRFWLKTNLSIFSELLVALCPAGNQCSLLGISPFIYHSERSKSYAQIFTKNYLCPWREKSVFESPLQELKISVLCLQLISPRSVHANFH